MSQQPPRIHYLNTDLDLVAASDLTSLTAALHALGVFPLSVQQGGDGQWYSILETSDQHGEPDETIRVMLDAIEALDGQSRRLWQECSKREFNIGYDCGDEPWAFNNGLTGTTIARIAAVGASLRITLYPHSPEDSTARPAAKCTE